MTQPAKLLVDATNHFENFRRAFNFLNPCWYDERILQNQDAVLSWLESEWRKADDAHIQATIDDHRLKLETCWYFYSFYSHTMTWERIEYFRLKKHMILTMQRLWKRIHERGYVFVATQEIHDQDLGEDLARLLRFPRHDLET